MRLLGWLALAGMVSLTACGGAGTSLSNIIGSATPTPAPPVSTADCPSSGSAPTALVQSSTQSSLRRSAAGAVAPPRYVPDELAVTYAAAVPNAGGTHIADLDFARMGVRVRVIGVDRANLDSEIARLRATPGVRDVGRITYAQQQSVTANDPYYLGFTGTSAPYYENVATPGQWDMHVINLDGAWAQFASAPISGAPIAIVDTGVDVTHPELVTPSGMSGVKIVRTKCYVTYPTSAAQTTGVYVTDTDGHGTDVAGIADGDTDNRFAFASAGFDAPLLAYRVFPTHPNADCEASNPPSQCFTTSTDIATAINDAVAHGAKVINLSLGASGPCSTNDPEYTAVESAIAAGVVVVAAAGNGSGSPPVGQPSLDCPAADPGVIAVGASALNDANPLNIYEYVASYSNYLTAPKATGAYLVAPGGDPSSNETCSTCTVDHLHWIEHIYSSTGYGISAGSTCSGGKDFAGESNDCNVLIAGTSQATPHVAGVVSMMLAKNPNLTPAQIAIGLCSTAVDIRDSKEGCGRLDASAAVNWAATH